MLVFPEGSKVHGNHGRENGNWSVGMVLEQRLRAYILSESWKERGGGGNCKCYESFETAKPNPSGIAPNSSTNRGQNIQTY